MSISWRWRTSTTTRRTLLTNSVRSWRRRLPISPRETTRGRRQLRFRSKIFRFLQGSLIRRRKSSCISSKTWSRSCSRNSTLKWQNLKKRRVWTTNFRICAQRMPRLTASCVKPKTSQVRRTRLSRKWRRSRKLSTTTLRSRTSRLSNLPGRLMSGNASWRTKTFWKINNLSTWTWSNKMQWLK